MIQYMLGNDESGGLGIGHSLEMLKGHYSVFNTWVILLNLVQTLDHINFSKSIIDREGYFDPFN